ncbi:hypothetical protein [Marinobacter zhejiangensis]|uniref:Uncharacterized protein n=1 Tax=Marinobacter zhejiangensis TaxID=488535 RepID=A0A1I4MGE9_9GAMM|nr:hypothetical protein [Marinobacter zhejiangensis]SFM02170.1 hypothetical protein SAMN04487963_1061 [Marinobacter zhejiangensis]
MISTTPEQNWLFDPSLLKLVHQCRRLIHAEFGIKLHLTDRHLEQQLANYAEKSRSSQLARVWHTLKPQIPGHHEITSKKESTQEGQVSRRVYRGQVIEEESRPASRSVHSEAGVDAIAAAKRKVIYRGQVIG